MRPWTVMVLGPVTLALGACSGGGLSDALGLGKRAPDEFAVARQQPLIMPPDFQLRPPQVGETGPATASPAERARANLLGQPPLEPPLGQSAAVPLEPVEPLPAEPLVAPSGATASEGTTALLERSRASDGAEPAPRAAEPARAQRDDSLLDRLLDWDRPEATAAGETPAVVRRNQTPLGELVERDS